MNSIREYFVTTYRTHDLCLLRTLPSCSEEMLFIEITPVPSIFYSLLCVRFKYPVSDDIPPSFLRMLAPIIWHRLAILSLSRLFVFRTTDAHLKTNLFFSKAPQPRITSLSASSLSHTRCPRAQSGIKSRGVHSMALSITSSMGILV